jgi:pimeloyl-ACP methyl ester carboxylesterase
MSKSKWLLSIVAVVLFLAVAAYVSARSGLLSLDDEARAQAAGEFVELSDGQVHYAWHGPSDGAVAVLVHGYSMPSFVWSGLLEPLTKAGFRVLAYDNYGRGFSDRPDADNDTALFDRQLTELLASQDVDVPINLVGYSMGGAIATYFAAHHSDKVAKLGLIAPAGFPVHTPFVTKLLAVPLLGDWLMAIVGKNTLLDRIAQPENQGRAIPDLARRYEIQMRYDGYLRSLLSTLRHYPLNEMEAEYESVGAARIPVLAIWGDEDPVVPPSNAALVAEAIPHAKFASVAGGTHAITYSEPEFVSAALVEFLQDSSTQEP